MQTTKKLKVADLNSLLTCILCNGYYIDATTIIECLHSFCRTCIVQYLQTNKFCPICEVQVHKTRPLENIRSDQTLQDIVYKSVPGLFKNEMKKRRDFYSQKHVQNCIPASSEKRGDIFGCDRLIFTSEDIISVSLEYCPLHVSFPLRLHSSTISSNNFVEDTQHQHETHRRYLRCPGAITVFHLKKLLRAKYDLNPSQKVEILYVHDFLRDEYTLTDLAYIYSWRRNGPLKLFYKIYETRAKRMKMNLISNTEASELISTEVMKLPSALTTPPKLSVSSPAPSVATAPSSQLQRHPSPPSSPRTAEEPDYVKVSKPNSASLQNESKANTPNMKTSLSLSKGGKFNPQNSADVPKINCSGQQPLVLNIPNGEIYPNKKRLSGNNLLSTDAENRNGQLLQSNLSAAFKSGKKQVTFSVDLVQTFYPNNDVKRKKDKLSSKRTLCKSVYRTSPITSVTVRERLLQMRNDILSKENS